MGTGRGSRTFLNIPLGTGGLGRSDQDTGRLVVLGGSWPPSSACPGPRSPPASPSTGTQLHASPWSCAHAHHHHHITRPRPRRQPHSLGHPLVPTLLLWAPQEATASRACRRKAARGLLSPPSACPPCILENHREGTWACEGTRETVASLASPRGCCGQPGPRPHPGCGRPSGSTHFLPPQKTSSPARTAGSGTAASGTCKPTSSTTAPAARVLPPQPRPPPTRSPRRPTPTSACAPSPSAAKAAPVPAPWRSTCAATAVRPTPRPRPRARTAPAPGLHPSPGGAHVALPPRSRARTLPAPTWMFGSGLGPC